MATSLPEQQEFIGNEITEGDFKVALVNMLTYLIGLLGKDGEISTARKTLQVPLSAIAEKTADYTARADDTGKVLRFTGGTAITLSLDAATALGVGWNLTVINDTSSTVTISPYTGEVIDGAATYVIKAGGRAGIVCDGTRIYTTVPAVPDSVGYATNANYANSSNYANSAGSVGGISTPVSRDTGAGGVGTFLYGRGGEVALNGTTGTVYGIGGYIERDSSVSNLMTYTQQYGGTWRNIGSRVIWSGSSSVTMWQRIA